MLKLKTRFKNSLEEIYVKNKINTEEHTSIVGMPECSYFGFSYVEFKTK